MIFGWSPSPNLEDASMSPSQIQKEIEFFYSYFLPTSPRRISSQTTDWRGRPDQMFFLGSKFKEQIAAQACLTNGPRPRKTNPGCGRRSPNTCKFSDDCFYFSCAGSLQGIYVLIWLVPPHRQIPFNPQLGAGHQERIRVVFPGLASNMLIVGKPVKRV